MVNFLALLGWSPGDGAEVLTRDELTERFSLDGISGGNAVFNPEKLEWMNAQHMARLSAAAIVELVRPHLESAGLWSAEFESTRRAWLEQAVDLVKPRVRRLPDFVTQLRPYLMEDVSYDEGAVAKHLSVPTLAASVAALTDAYRGLDHFDASTTETALRDTAAARGVKAATLIHATRVAVTGQAVSPGLFDVLHVLGRERTVARLTQLERYLRSRENS
jgi:glutamyl-tRNA synthetase